MSEEKEILDKELSFNYGEELDKIQNHIFQYFYDKYWELRGDK